MGVSINNFVAVIFQLVHPERVGTEAKRETKFEELHRS